MLRKIALIVGLFLPCAILAQTYTPTDIFPPLTSGTNSAVIGTVTNNIPSQLHTVQFFVTGAPTVCSAHIYGSLKAVQESPAYPADFQDISGAIDCTTITMLHVANKSVRSVVIGLTTLSGGTNPTVNFRYVGR